MVFALRGSVWVTTSRGSVKARAWRADPPSPDGAGRRRRGGLHRNCRTYDLFEVGSWVRGLAAAPTLASASTRFTRKNARFFAGYAVDARHVPLSWTLPDAYSRLSTSAGRGPGPREVAETIGGWPRARPSIERFRAAGAGGTLEGLPDDVHPLVGDRGEARWRSRARAG
jgi:hypothetical protein